MPRLKIDELEAKLRKGYPLFSHVVHDGHHLIGRSHHVAMDTVNQISWGSSYREALETALNACREKKRAQQSNGKIFMRHRPNADSDGPSQHRDSAA